MKTKISQADITKFFTKKSAKSNSKEVSPSTDLLQEIIVQDTRELDNENLPLSYLISAHPKRVKISPKKLQRKGRLKDITKVLSYKKMEDKIVFEVMWKTSLGGLNTWEEKEFLRDSQKFYEFLEEIFDLKVVLLKKFYDKFITIWSKDFEESSTGLEHAILKDLDNFDINEFQRTLLLSLILSENNLFDDPKLREVII